MALIFLLCRSGAAGLYYEQESRVRSAGGGETAKEVRLKIFVQSGMIRIEYANGGQTVIARLKEGIVWSIDERRKEYVEATFDAVVAYWQQTRRARGITEESRGIASTTRGAKDRTVLNHPCQHYVISSGDNAVLELWAAKDLDFPEKETIYEYRTKMGEFSPAILNEIRNIPGFPLVMDGATYIGAEKMNALREVTCIKKEDIDPGRFELPAGLKKITVGEK